MANSPATQSWSLEVVRGANVGRRFTLQRGETILGNAPDGAPSINLADQEGNAPRRMAARQARIDWRNGNPVVADLESPGGTFVNRQRVLPGKGRPLEADDVIQLGGVQLRLVASAPEPSKSAPQPVPNRPFAIVLPFGSTCRSWDDFLAVSAQKWDELRQELTSGRLAGTLAAQGMSALAPDPNTPGSPDDRLDAWLASLPTSKSAAPELALHPASLKIRPSAEGGTTERVVSITNTGYRILRGSVRVEPAGCSWVKVEPEGDAKAFAVVEELRLRVRITTPMVMTETMAASLVVDTNGGTGVVAISLETGLQVADPFTSAAAGEAEIRAGWIDRIALISGGKRLIFGVLGCGALGLLLGLADRVAPATSDGARPGLQAVAIAFAALGAIGGGWAAMRRGTAADVPAAIGSAGVAGVMAAAVVVGIGRVLGDFAGAGLGSVVAWAVLGAALAGMTIVLAPYREGKDIQA